MNNNNNNSASIFLPATSLEPVVEYVSTPSTDIQQENTNMETATETTVITTEPRATVRLEMDCRKIMFVGGSNGFWSVRMNDHHQPGRVYSYSNYSMVAAFLNGYSAMHHTKTYPVNEVGLHLKFDYATLQMMGSVEDAGYIKDMQGNWHVANWQAGDIVTGRQLVYIKYTENEPEWIKADRKAVNKMIAMDILCMGFKVELLPVFENDKEAQSDTKIKGSGALHVARYLAYHCDTLLMDADEARKVVGQHIQNKIAYREMGRAYSQVATNTAPAIRMETVGIVVDKENGRAERKAIEVLTDRVGILFKGQYPLPGKRNLNDQAVLVAIQKNGYNVWLCD